MERSKIIGAWALGAVLLASCTSAPRSTTPDTQERAPASRPREAASQAKKRCSDRTRDFKSWEELLTCYRAAITDSEFGYAAAVGLVLFVLIFSLTLLQRRLFGQAPSW